ncbi:MAG: universal stress protein [Methanosarcinaceae archaeon]|nr:universal stress protein [Methanosarcinaceae archaeon]
MYKKILVLVKVSKGSNKAIETSCTLAKQLDASVHMITIHKENSDEVDKLSVKRMEDAVEFCKTNGLSNVTCEIVNIKLDDDIVEKVADIASDFDMILMGHCKYNKIYKFLRDSIAEDLIRISPCPVMIVTAECGGAK